MKAGIDGEHHRGGDVELLAGRAVHQLPHDQRRQHRPRERGERLGRAFAERPGGRDVPPHLVGANRVDGNQRHGPSGRRAAEAVGGDEREVEPDVDGERGQVVVERQLVVPGLVEHRAAGAGHHVGELAEGQDDGDRGAHPVAGAEQGEQRPGEDEDDGEEREREARHPARGRLVGDGQAPQLSPPGQVGHPGREGLADRAHGEGGQHDDAGGHAVDGELGGADVERQDQLVHPEEALRRERGQPGHRREPHDLPRGEAGLDVRPPHEHRQPHEGEHGRDVRHHDERLQHAGQAGTGPDGDRREHHPQRRVEHQPQERVGPHRAEARAGGQRRHGDGGRAVPRRRRTAAG